MFVIHFYSPRCVFFLSRRFVAFSVIDISLKCVCVAQREIRVGRAANHVRDGFVWTWVHWNLHTAILSSPQNANMIHFRCELGLDFNAMRKIVLKISYMILRELMNSPKSLDVVMRRKRKTPQSGDCQWASCYMFTIDHVKCALTYTLARWRTNTEHKYRYREQRRRFSNFSNEFIEATSSTADSRIFLVRMRKANVA